MPIAAHAIMEGGALRLTGVVADLQGTRLIRATGSGSADAPEALGARVGKDLLRQGARAILESIKEVT